MLLNEIGDIVISMPQYVLHNTHSSSSISVPNLCLKTCDMGFKYLDEAVCVGGGGAGPI